MKRAKKIVKGIIIIMLIPGLYILASLILTFIPINNKKLSDTNEFIYLSSNGVHLSIVLSKKQVDGKILDGLNYSENDRYFAFGWGDRDFYLHTPTWSDLTFSNAFKALFLKTPTLIHSIRYTTMRRSWVEVKVTNEQLKIINQYIYESFYIDAQNKKKILNNKGYSYNDDFYEALGSYSCFKTSNSWVNSGLKESGVKACLWTPFDFGLLRIHKK